ncbi:hypothetical protein NE237_001372 [Protea cynaroides]|uniref:RING-type domain-containing protein n=1 Tax=Protea cynaroides TaxID=273540 RepID=A0A9Q0KU13_9MAGN|nr:hypothetical protein NE237_001372 [Protea cynaroides]
MAFSQVQIASAHFGSVLKDHNWRHSDKERESNDNVRAQEQASFDKNLKDFVINSCIAFSGSRDSVSDSDENSENRVDKQEKNDHNLRPPSRVEEEARVDEKPSPIARNQSRIIDRRATREAREMIITMDRQTHESELLALSNSHPVSTVASSFPAESPHTPSESSVDLPNLHTSSLLQMWREFEAESKLTSGNHSSLNSNSTIFGDGRIDSGTSNLENASVENRSQSSEVCDSGDERYEASATHEYSFADWESERNTPCERLPSLQGSVSDDGRATDVGESERHRVADIIRKLTSGKPIATHSSITPSNDELDQDVPTVIDPVPEQGGENRGLPNVGKGARVRGRQAMMDLLMQMERERQRELNELVERRAVSRFSQRGRIQSMLKLRFLRLEVAAIGQQPAASAASELCRLQQGTSILALRRKFSPNRDDGEIHSGESADNTKCHTQLPDSEHFSTSDQIINEEVPHQEVTMIEQESTPPMHHSMPSISEDRQEEAIHSSDHASQGTSLVVSNLSQEGSIAKIEQEITPSSHHSMPSINDQIINEEVPRQEVTMIEQESTPPMHHSMPSISEDREEEAIHSSDHASQGTSLVVSNLSQEGSIAKIEQEITPSSHHSMPSINEDLREEARQSSHHAWKGMSLMINHLAQEGSINTVTASHDSEGNGTTKEPELDTEQHDGSTDGTWLGDFSSSQSDWRHSRQAWYKDVLDNNYEDRERNLVTEEPESDMQLAGSTDGTWLTDGFHPQTDWTEQPWHQNVLENNSEDREGNVVTDEPYPDMEQLEGSTDGTWLGDVSCPPRDWRCSREDWYQEVLNNSENGEIRELLQRRRVSNFLASELKETMDQMIMSSFHRRRHQSEAIGREENLFEHPDPEASSTSLHFTSTSFSLPLSMSYNLPLPNQLRSRNWCLDHEARDVSAQVASTSLQPSKYQCQDNLQSTINHRSLEMDLISDLRGHIVRLHDEIYELRKSMESCMDMQNKLQHSIKKEVSAAVYQSVHGGEATELLNLVPMRNGKCCMCYEMQVDSLLYRCGHMCTCFKCAHELQWSTGRCPICEAPILDVVRAYPNS